MRDMILPEFQEFLIAKKLVPEKYAKFYAHWVSRFLSFSNQNCDILLEDRVCQFLDKLGSHNDISDWQVQQADRAIKVYINNYLDGDCSIFYPEKRNDNSRPQPEYKDVIKKMHDALRLRHYAYRTERTYIDWIRKFYRYLDDTHEDSQGLVLESKHLKSFLSHLALKRRVSASTQNQAFNALSFLYKHILNIDIGDMSKIVRAKRGIRLPVVLSVDEVHALFGVIEGANLLMVQLLYGSGMRLMELARLRVKDIDFESGLVIVRSGKGDKDRSTMLPESLKEDLYLHLDNVKALHTEDLQAGYGEVYLPDALSRKYPNAGKEWRWQYVFPAKNLSVDPRSGKVRRHHISGKAIQDAVKKAVRLAGINKHATVHTLRHSFATHLLMSGVNIRKIQDYLGHKNVETTMIYTHVIRDICADAESPLDILKRRDRERKG